MASGREGLTTFGIPVPKLESFNPAVAKSAYDSGGDILRVSCNVNKAATSVDLDGEVWLRIDPVNGDVLGFEIEDFEAVFLKKHPEVAPMWKEIKQLMKRKDAVQQRQLFIARLLKTLSTFHPQQAGFVSP